MYRQTSLRVPCAVCGIEQPLSRLELAPRGGHWCWTCQVAAQVAEHQQANERVGDDRRLVLIVGMTALSLVVLWVGTWALALLFGLAHFC